jgi:succinate-semialdehyde dehydrogenase/glutarate-semialdehyde dehydrogenase
VGNRRGALERARLAFEPWAARTLADRGAIVTRIGAELRARRGTLQTIMTARGWASCGAKALAEVEKCAACCDYYAAHAADYLREQEIPTEARRSYVRFAPMGCVFAIMPWNYPIWQVFRFLVPR